MVRGWLRSVPKRWANSFACNQLTPFWIACQGFAVRPWSEGEGDFASQSQRLYDLLVCQKRIHRFAEVDGAGGHCCGLGASLWEAVVFDWIDQVLG
jgi:hypothetical protein